MNRVTWKIVNCMHNFNFINIKSVYSELIRIILRVIF